MRQSKVHSLFTGLSLSLALLAGCKSTPPSESLHNDLLDENRLVHNQLDKMVGYNLVSEEETVKYLKDWNKQLCAFANECAPIVLHDKTDVRTAKQAVGVTVNALKPNGYEKLLEFRYENQRYFYPLNEPG